MKDYRSNHQLSDFNIGDKVKIVALTDGYMFFSEENGEVVGIDYTNKITPIRVLVNWSDGHNKYTIDFPPQALEIVGKVKAHIGLYYYETSDPILLGDKIVMEDMVMYHGKIYGTVTYDKSICQYLCVDDSGTRHVIQYMQYKISKWE